jgi:hypothetical protein
MDAGGLGPAMLESRFEVDWRAVELMEARLEVEEGPADEVEGWAWASDILGNLVAQSCLMLYQSRVLVAYPWKGRNSPLTLDTPCQQVEITETLFGVK